MLMSMADVRVIHPSDRVLEIASGAMRREEAISERLTGARKVWTGYVELDPGEISAAHHHGDAESSIYLIAGHARFVTEGGTYEADAGDFVFVPPHVVHVEVNRSASEPIRMVVSRSTQQALVFNVEMPPGWAARAVAR